MFSTIITLPASPAQSASGCGASITRTLAPGARPAAGASLHGTLPEVPDVD
jgi:hypothetical protein